MSDTWRTDLTEVALQALEALETLARYENPETQIQVRKPKGGGMIVTMYPHKVASDAAKVLRERLARQEDEPQPAREWKGLPDMLVYDLADTYLYGGKNYGILSFYKAIEKALKEKNT